MITLKDMAEEIRQLIAPHRGKRGVLIQMLQEIQNKYGYLSEDAISAIAEETEIPASKVYSVASFYSQFKFKSPGIHQIKVCSGTTCHVRGGQSIIERVECDLGIRYGETTDDGKISLGRVACMGCCALAPVIVIDGDVHGKVAQKELGKLLNNLCRIEDDKQTKHQ
ncbi:MAG: NADH-quinone oxidoreductase subunit NuoE [Methanotrichaceae archaeon]